jgi:hypothetical protein
MILNIIKIKQKNLLVEKCAEYIENKNKEDSNYFLFYDRGK